MKWRIIVQVGCVLRTLSVEAKQPSEVLAKVLDDLRETEHKAPLGDDEQLTIAIAMFKDMGEGFDPFLEMEDAAVLAGVTPVASC